MVVQNAFFLFFAVLGCMAVFSSIMLVSNQIEDRFGFWSVITYWLLVFLGMCFLLSWSVTE